MGCEHKIIGGTHVIVCSRGRKRAPKCEFCDAVSTKQCDYPLDKQHTCDAYICDRCSKPFGPNVDTCPRHPVMRFF
jgi:hypothetical protein